MEKFDRSGVWWLPEDGRSQAAGGRLKFDDSRGLHLSRVGLQTQPCPFDAGYDVILGQSTDGRLWTLADCRWPQPSYGSFGDQQVTRELCRPEAAYACSS